MADRVRADIVTVPTATPIATPISQVLSPTNEIVVELEIVIPSGHAGLTGLKIFYANEPIIPYRGTNWIIANDEVIHWPLEDQPTGGQWVAKAYNLDNFTHAFYLRFLVNDIPAPPPPPVLPLADIVGASLGSSVDLTSLTDEGT